MTPAGKQESPTPSGFRNVHSASYNSGRWGEFDHKICVDETGNAYLHVYSKPKIHETFIATSGKSAEAAMQDFNHALAARLTPLMEEQGAALHYVDPDAGHILYSIHDCNLLNIENVGDNPHAMASRARNIFQRFSSGEERLRFLAGAAHNDLVASLPPTDLKTCLKRIGAMANSRDFDIADRAGFYTEVLEGQAETLKTIESELSKGGINKFRYLGSGRTGICLAAEMSTGGKVAVMIRTTLEPKRRYIPQHLQALHTFMAGKDLHIEVTPKLDNISVTEQHNDALSAAIAPQGYVDGDRGLRNIGLSHGKTPYYLDGDSIHVKGGIEGDIAASSPHVGCHTWIETDGTWRQYREFEAEHRIFNSPLHQRQSKAIVAALPPNSSSESMLIGRLEKEGAQSAAHGGKVGWIIGGTVALGAAGFALCSIFKPKEKPKQASNAPEDTHNNTKSWVSEVIIPRSGMQQRL